jgi:hypothetical protein
MHRKNLPTILCTLVAFAAVVTVRILNERENNR